MNTQQLADQLEPLVDKHGMIAVLEALALICSTKADQALSNPEIAFRWDVAAGRLIKLEHDLFR